MAGLKGKVVAVTGAGGFIGSHLAQRLVKEGAQVRALVHYRGDSSRGWLEGVGDMEIVAGDVRDPDCVSNLIEGADTVFHLAALIGIPYSYQAPLSYLDVNVSGSLNVFRAALRHGCRRVIQTSTSEVYGTAKTVPITESHPLQGQSPYAASKISADTFAEAYHRSFDLPVVTIRPFNTFGPRQSARAVVATIVSQALKGDTILLGSLAPTRDLNYVDNTVDGFVAAAKAEKVEGKTIHLGSGREISIGDLAALTGKVLGKDLEIVEEERRKRPQKSEVGRLVADSSLALSELGWKPTVSLEDGLAKTADWMKEHPIVHTAGNYAV